MIKALAVFLAVAFSMAASAQLATISSVYPDLSRAGKSVKVRGTGFLVKYQGRVFAFTASHVSQGQNLQVDFEGKSLTVIGRQVAQSNDAELLEVQGADLQKVAFEAGGNLIRFNGQWARRRRLIEAHNFVPLLDWIFDPNVDIDNAESAGLSSLLSLDLFGLTLHAPAIVQPGTSGAPLITEYIDGSAVLFDAREGFDQWQKGSSYVRGLVIRRERFFAQSSFVPTARLIELLVHYLKGEKSSPETKWLADGSVLYRTMPSDDLSETAVMSTATAGGLVEDSGNGVSMDGGDTATLSEDSPEAFLKSVSPFPAANGRPALYWMYLSRDPRDSAMVSFWSWFDMENYPVLASFQLLLTSPQDSDTLNLENIAFNRFGKYGTYVSTGGDTKIVLSKGRIEIYAVFGTDIIDITMDTKGNICGKDGTCSGAGFRPVMEVVSNSNTSYLIDLRQLFFVDPSASISQLFHAPQKIQSDQWQNIQAQLVEIERTHPRLSIRPKANVSGALTNAQLRPLVVEWKLN